MADDLIHASRWLITGRRGKYFSGQVSEAVPASAQVLIFKNDRKQPGSNEPDYTLYFMSPEDQLPMGRAEPEESKAQFYLGGDEIPF